MAAVAIQRVTKQFGTQIVLFEASCELNASETVGLVGANGAGKTTLFRLITRELTPDTGTIICERGLQVGYLRQEPEIDPERTLHDEAGSAFTELLALEQKLHALSDAMAESPEGDRLRELMDQYERTNARFIAAGGHTFETRLNEVLGGLGFTPSEYGLRMSALSGGQKCRAALAKLLLADRSFLLLDEPTNHLDIDAVRWLEKFLAGHKGGAVIISHDRYLLDRLCDRIVELDRARLTSYSGNYSTYVNTKEVQTLTQQRQFEKDADFIRKERAFIAKHLAGQRTKEAQGRRTRLERRLKAGEFVTDAPTTKRETKLSFAEAETGAGAILRCEGLRKAFDDKVLFDGLSFQVLGGECFGITGPNGTGKTTLLRILVGEAAADAGKAVFDPKLSQAYFAQEAKGLAGEQSILDEVRAFRPELSEHEARSLLARYRFIGDDVFKPLNLLSGGEQSRVRLVKLILSAPDILILDEPTNHLDIASREALEEALLQFPGTIIVVSHDRYLLDRLCDRLMVIRRDAAQVYAGNYSFYVDQVEREREAARPAAKAASKAAGKMKRKGRSDGGPTKQSSPYDHMTLEALEELVMQHEVELAALHERFGDPALYQDPDALAELTEKSEEVARTLAEVDAAWQQRVTETQGT